MTHPRILLRFWQLKGKSLAETSRYIIDDHPALDTKSFEETCISPKVSIRSDHSDNVRHEVVWRPARYGTLVLHIIPLQRNLYRKGDPETRIGLGLQCYADIASSKWDAEDCKGKTVYLAVFARTITARMKFLMERI